MMVNATKRANEIPPFIVMDVLERAHELEREGRDIIHLEIGEPDFPTPGWANIASRLIRTRSSLPQAPLQRSSWSFLPF